MPHFWHPTLRGSSLRYQWQVFLRFLATLGMTGGCANKRGVNVRRLRRRTFTPLSANPNGGVISTAREKSAWWSDALPVISACLKIYFNRDSKWRRHTRSGKSDWRREISRTARNRRRRQTPPFLTDGASFRPQGGIWINEQLIIK